MKRLVPYAATLFGAVLAYLLLLQTDPRLAQRVDILLVALGGLARISSPSATILAGSILGGIADVLTGDLVGLHGFSKSLLGFLFKSLGHRVQVDHPAVVGLFLAGGVVFEQGIVSLLRWVISQPAAGFDPELLAVRTVATALAGIAVHFAARHPWKQRWQERRRRKLRS